MKSKAVSLKERDQMYRLIISQLFYDGHQDIAVRLSNAVKAAPACSPSDRLAHVVASGLNAIGESQPQIDAETTTGLDLECKPDDESISPEPSQYETIYILGHKAPSRTAVFHRSGNLVATASEDASIKILDVERVVARSHSVGDPDDQGFFPVLRTLHDHTSGVSCLDFHPREQILVSGGRDMTIKFFDYSKPANKRAFKTIYEGAPMRAVAFHPSGDFLLAGTEQPTLRMYDVNTAQCFVSCQPSDQHTKPITTVQYNSSGSMYATSSKDGDVRLWDVVSGRCVNVLSNAHDEKEVCSVCFSRNSKYLLTCGKDSIVKLWELSTARCLVAYTGAGATGRMAHRVNAAFNHTEDYVMFPDEATISLCSWDSRNAERQRLLGLGHTQIVRCIAHSPTIAAFVTTGEDCKARFWYRGAG